jgi:hypothetical protein
MPSRSATSWGHSSLTLLQHPSADQVSEAVRGQQIREIIKALCADDFRVFMKVELGFELGPQHEIWWSHLNTGDDVCEMAPRDHGKSHCIARAYPLWKVKYDPWVRDVMLLGADQDSAVENLDKIKSLMEASPYLNHLIPKTRRDNFFSRTEVRLTNGKTIKAKGIGSPIRGRHPQLIVLDDVLNERNTLDPTNRDEMKTYFNKVVVPMKDKGLESDRLKGYRSQIVMVGTAQDYEDLYHDLLENPEYRGVKLKAIIDEETKEVLWPSRYPYDDLVKLRTKVGALVFAQEYQQEPISDETSLFPKSLFKDLLNTDFTYENTFNSNQPVYMGVDFSIPGSLDGDYTVIIVFTLEPEEEGPGKFRLLNYYRGKPNSMQEQIHLIELWCQKYGVTLGYLEDNMFQRVYARHFTTSSNLPLKGHTVTGSKKLSKEFGILSFRPLFENGRWILPYKTEEDQTKTDLLISEFTGIRQKKGKIGNEQTHDDIVMAMWHALIAYRDGNQFKVSWC